MKRILSGRRILVVEDEYFLAEDLAQAIRDQDGEVVGPAAEQEMALKLLAEQLFDVAVVDINLKGRADFLVADGLAARGIPFVFSTGYDAEIIPERHRQVRRWEKPFKIAALVKQLA